MVEVEPEGNEADDVDNRSPHNGESLLDEKCAGQWRKHVVNAENLLELHLSPELDEVHNQEGEDDPPSTSMFCLTIQPSWDALRWRSGRCPGLAVLEREHYRINDVDDEEQSQTC